MQAVFLGTQPAFYLFITSAAYVTRLGRTEFICWKIDLSEQFAWIVAGSNALIFGNAEIEGGNQHLYIADDLYDREQTDRDINCVFLRVHFNRRGVAGADRIRNDAAGFVAAMTVSFTEFCRKCDRFCDLNGGFREIAVVIADTAAAVAGEHLCAAFAAEQNGFLVKY